MEGILQAAGPAGTKALCGRKHMQTGNEALYSEGESERWEMRLEWRAGPHLSGPLRPS